MKLSGEFLNCIFFDKKILHTKHKKQKIEEKTFFLDILKESREKRLFPSG